jgi:FkbM family methyltransferase
MIFYSQRQEDKWLYDNNKIKPMGFFLDVGCAHPNINSNTNVLEQTGWNGICIDADETWSDMWINNRKNSTFINCLIDKDDNEDKDFHISNIHEISSLKVFGDGYLKKIKTRTINSILEEHQVKKVDLVSLDVEGNELNALIGFDIEKYNPSIFIVEYKNLDGDNFDAIEYLVSKQYTKIHTTEFNFILEKK